MSKLHGFGLMSDSEPIEDIYQEGVWHTINVFRDFDPNYAKAPLGTVAIFVEGILIITHGLADETADLHVHWRTTGDPLDMPYRMQICERSVKNGIRCNAASWIALSDDGSFDVKWTRTTPGTYPANSSYGINMKASAFAIK